MKQVIVTVTPTGTSWNPSINLVAGPATNCATTPRVCLAGADAAATGAAETLVYTNLAAAGAEVFIIVGSSSSTGQGTFDMTVAFADPPAGDLCANAQTLTGTTTLTAQTLTGYSNNYSPASSGPNCTGSGAPSADRVYSVNVAMGQTLTVSVTRTSGTADHVVYFVQGPETNCTSTIAACLAGADDQTSGAVETATWTNGTAAAVPVLVIVDAYSGTIAQFDLAVTLTP